MLELLRSPFSWAMRSCRSRGAPNRHQAAQPEVGINDIRAAQQGDQQNRTHVGELARRRAVSAELTAAGHQR